MRQLRQFPMFLLVLGWMALLIPSTSTAAAPFREPGTGVVGLRAPVACTFEVRVPEKTPPGEGIFLIGNHSLLGEWKGTGAPMQKTGPGVFLFKAEFPAGTSLEFKFTRGDFARVEKNAQGGEIPNRTFQVTGNQPLTARFQVAAWADQVGAHPAPQITGRYELLPDFPSRFLDHSRNVWVLLPPSYGKAAGRDQRYPVLYMHDGNNLFDPGTSFGGVDWGVDETVDFLSRTGQMREIIVVGVGNSPARNDEYTPFPDPKHGGGKGDLYGRFLIEELKPAIDARFRTLVGAADTTIAGSSLGGLISLYLGLRHPEVFSAIIAVSPSFWWADGGIVPWSVKQKVDPARLRLWTDIGLKEGAEALDFCRRFDREFRGAFPALTGFVYREFPNAAHNEAAWRARFAQPLLFLFGTRKAGPPPSPPTSPRRPPRGPR